MDRFGEWRPIEPAVDDGDDRSPAQKSDTPATRTGGSEANALSVRLAGLLGAAVLAVVGVSIWLTTPSAPAQLELRGAAAVFNQPATLLDGASLSAGPSPAVELVVDVQGAVTQPGVHRLPAGSRVGDAIAQAGGYSPEVDIAAATALLNLAAPLTDGAKIQVPARGEAGAVTVTPVGPSGGDPSGSGGVARLINVNTATPDELDTLPGIGPVTAGKIIAAREQAAFAAVDELLSREVVGPATLEKIRDLVTVGP